jgi:glycosyltransferase involved in cell wall biosynthesis
MLPMTTPRPTSRALGRQVLPVQHTVRPNEAFTGDTSFRSKATTRPAVLHWVFGNLRKRGSFEDYLVASAREAQRSAVRMHVTARSTVDPEVLRALMSAGVDVQCTPDDELNSLAHFARRVVRIRPTLVHCHFGSPSTSLALVAKLLGVRRFVFTDHGSRTALDVAGCPISPRRLRRRLYGSFIDLYLPVSDFVAEQIVREVGVPRGRIARLFNGIDVGRFRPASDQQERVAQRARQFGVAAELRCVVYVGQLTEEKGVADILAIQDEILRRHADVAFVWIGDGPLSIELERRLSPRVRYLGLRNDVEALLPLADVIVAPSRWHEAFCLTVAEAAAAGVPAIAARVGGVPEVVADGETGLLIPAGNPGALAAALDRLLGDDTLRLDMGAAARCRAEALFSLETMVATTFDHYRRLGLQIDPVAESHSPPDR